MPVFVSIKDPQSLIQANDEDVYGFGVNTVTLYGDADEKDIDYNDRTIKSFVKDAANDNDDNDPEVDIKFDAVDFRDSPETGEITTKINET